MVLGQVLFPPSMVARVDSWRLASPFKGKGKAACLIPYCKLKSSVLGTTRFFVELGELLFHKPCAVKASLAWLVPMKHVYVYGY